MRLPGIVGDTRRKFSHRLKDWRKVTGYDQRQEYCSGKTVSAVKYHLPTGIPELAGTRLAFVSDLHWEGGSATEKLMCEEMNAFIAEFKPEYLLFGGDAITYTCNLNSAIEALKNLPVDSSARIAVMGNWERSKKWLTIQDWKAFYQAANFKLIVNEEYEDDRFLFFGIDDIKIGKPVFSGEKPAGKMCVLLAHSPDSAVLVGRKDALEKIDLILCGHTHGGQVRIPFLGAIATSSRYYRKFDYGLYENVVSGTKMLVSSGLGASAVPFRFLCRREIVFIEFS